MLNINFTYVLIINNYSPPFSSFGSVPETMSVLILLFVSGINKITESTIQYVLK